MTMARMAVMTGVRKLDIRSYPVPEPEEGQVLIKIEAAAICGSDQHAFNNPIPYQTALGHEFVGKIVKMGRNAGKSILCYDGEVSHGDRIAVYPWLTCGHCKNCLTYGRGTCTVCDTSFFYGGPVSPMGHEEEGWHSSNPDIYPHFKAGYGEYCILFPGTYVWKLPEGMPASVAALLDPMAVAVRGIELAQTQCGVKEEALNINTNACIVGAGPIGIMAGMILKMMGVSSVTMVDGIAAKLEKAKELGAADYIVDFTMHPDRDERTRLINGYTDGGPQLVLQCANTVYAFMDALHYVRRLGTVVEIGNAADYGKTVECNPAALICTKHLRVMGMSANQPGTYDKAFRLLKRYRQYPFDKLFTHTCTLDTLKETLGKMRDPDYIKGVCLFEEK